MFDLKFATQVSDRPLYCLVANSHNGTVCVGGADHTLTEVCGKTGTPLRTLDSKQNGHSDWVTSVDALFDGRIVSGSMDSSVKLWSALSNNSNKHRPSLQNNSNATIKFTKLSPTRPPISGSNTDLSPSHTSSISSIVALHPHSSAAVTTSYDGTLKLWDLHSPARPKCLTTLALSTTNSPSQPPSPILGSCFHASSGHVVAWTRSGSIHVIDLPKTQPLSTTSTSTTSSSIQAHRGPVTSASFLTPDSESLIVSSGLSDGAVKLFDLRIDASRGRCVGRVEGVHESGVTGFISGFHGGDVVTVGGCDGTLKRVDILRLKCVVDNVTVVSESIVDRSWGINATIRSGSGGDMRSERFVGGSFGSLAVPSPARIAYGLCRVKDKVVVGWGDGSVHVVSGLDRSCGDVSVERLETRKYNISNALRVIKYHELNQVLYGAGDDGVFICWDT